MARKFIDEAKIFVKAGDGGRGCVAFEVLHGKRGGKKRPAGGDGGAGGAIVLVGDHNLDTLADFHMRQHYKAENGRAGQGSNRIGRRGRDCEIHLPTGTIIRRESGQRYEVLQHEQRLVLLEGGAGGRGNQGVKRVPEDFTSDGEICEGEWISLELRLMADVGVVGLPNAGKSTFVGGVSQARPKVADYPFTTLEPRLGVVEMPDGERFTIADIPGLIAGAHKGVGLGNRFLRHLSRVRILLHLVDASAEDPLGDYEVLLEELRAWSGGLIHRERVVVLNKCDTLTDDAVDALLERMPRHQDQPPLTASGKTGSGVQEVLERLYRLL